jgi:hypothetical protein
MSVKKSGRKPYRESIKQIIEELQSESLTFSELEHNLDIPKKSLARYLNDLSYWKLIIKDDTGRWTWYENIRWYISRELVEIALTHSFNLLPALEFFLVLDYATVYPNPKDYVDEQIVSIVRKYNSTIGTDDALENQDYVEQHLRTGYSKLYKTILRYRQLIEKRKETLREFSVTRKRLNTLPSSIIYDIQRGIMQYQSPSWWQFWKSAPSEQIPEEIQIFLKDFGQIDSEITQTYEYVAGRIGLLIKQVRHGTPLKGRCTICPPYDILNKNN